MEINALVNYFVKQSQTLLPGYLVFMKNKVKNLFTSELDRNTVLPFFFQKLQIFSYGLTCMYSHLVNRTRWNTDKTIGVGQ